MGIQFIKSDVILKFSLNAGCYAVFKRSTNRIIPGDCATLASNELLECSIQFAKKKLINRKRAFKRHNDAPKRGILGYILKMFSTFFPITNL